MYYILKVSRNLLYWNITFRYPGAKILKEKKTLQSQTPYT